MLYQIGIFTKEIVSNARKRIREFARTNYTKISATMMAAKMFSIFAILAFVPLANVQPNHQSYQTAVKLDTNSPFTVVGKDRQVNITTGQANVDGKRSIPVVRREADVSGVENFIALYKDAAARYGIPWQVLAAVHYVETGASGSTDRGSYAGARGPMQFMPGTWRAYGIDADNDGTADISNVTDAVYGAANLLAAGGAAEGNVNAALFNYNHSQSYVNKVNEVASSIQ